ncbi:MAG: nitrophenyl compound nitroreductase subunit ArsF family protein [Paludibacter sp.]|nr:nitrophenyl compound nitroreductase subunit ArsF family protein [Paludibacter sp.]
MKKLVYVSAFVLLVASLFTVSAVNPQKKGTATITKLPKVEVYYFHYTRRCSTCQAVETESQKAVSALYPTQLKEGKIHFQAINLDDKGSNILASKCKAEGQVLLVISSGKRIDLTEQGFMYALNKPEKLKAELKKTIDPLL